MKLALGFAVVGLVIGLVVIALATWLVNRASVDDRHSTPDEHDPRQGG